VAIVVTDSRLVTVVEAPVKVVHQPNEVLDRMDPWNKSTHRKTGLIDKVKAARQSEAEVEAELIAFLVQYLPRTLADVRQFDLPGPPLPRPVHAQARSILPLPQPGCFHAQGTCEALEAGNHGGLTKHGKHEALADIYESIEELKYYREIF